ncbi:unnamed protein product [Brassicogethes aeneus]|uniref:Protein kintoun n=1 Tax=Brassicogethes aeneus TaxID=1431903 RepID=A0A9P0FHK4_BRAAE|nr:unnamed protein product [Brassicogethes aeneus]
MANSFEKLQNLDLSRDEVHRIGEALKNQEFRKLFTEYVEEIQDPENRKKYEEEIAQLEKERGVDVTFIHPNPGYVIKTSLDGVQKCFINVCANELIAKPTSFATVKEGSRGLQWSLPHSISPPRDDLDNKKIRCQVYDIVFHPDTLHLAERNKAFKCMVNSTALEAVEGNFDVKLDKKNLKFPKLQYKGVPKACIRRTPSKNAEIVQRTPEEKEFYDKIYANADSYSTSPKKTKKAPKKHSEGDKSQYTTPQYVIKHRSHIEMQDYTEHKETKINAATPKELIIEVNLPLLKSSSDIQLDVTEKTVQLISEKPAKYKLNITLPYCVNESTGNAKFEKDLKKLIVTLPVKRTNKLLLIDSIEDSGVESHASTESDEETSDKSDVTCSDSDYRTEFLDSNLFYNLPEFTCHLFDNTLAYTLNVKNVDEDTVEKMFDDAGSSLHVKFTSISSSYYPTYYAFYVKLQHTILPDKISIETWDNNLIIQIPFNGDSSTLKSYLYGLNASNLTSKTLEEPSIINTHLEDIKPSEIETSEPEKTKAIDITSIYDQSSCDELSCNSCSPSLSKGILKRLSSKRSAVVRSISESSLDDFVPSSFENCASFDSVIPEEDGEVSTSLKKTVRFNDTIKRQLFRSNSSILGQKKKNQRKARNKKRAHDRRHSESELSEVDEKQEGDSKTSLSTDTEEEQCDKSRRNSQNDIFHLDMDH